ncbi:exopolysaccharide transport family protein [Breoghania sp.]|uniref:GumC family protein n=1 Tax=Breoghania sp. TaxID=2065378 RepID=UPI0029CA7E85|nr:exopolysaccharide transport family protein [Breoghania sp.]
MAREYRGVDEDVSVDVTALGRALWRAKRWLVPLVLITAVGTFAAMQAVTPKYRGQAKILIESQGAVYPGIDRNVEGERALLDQEGVASQVQLLNSYDLARRVAKKLELSKRAEFNPGKADQESLLGTALKFIGLSRSGQKASVEERVLEGYFDRLVVYQVEKTRVITVEFSSRDPELAATAANTIVQEYLDLQAVAKRVNTEEAADSLGPEVERVRDDVEKAERAVEEYRASNDLLIGSNNVTLVQQQLADLNTQLATSRAQKAEVEAKASQLQAMLEQGSLDSATEVMNSPLIQRLRERQVALQARIADLSTSLLPSHPDLRALQRQLRDLNGQIVAEGRKILSGLESDVRVAESREVSLMKSLNQLKAQVAQNNEARIRLRELERDAKVKGAQLEALLQRYREQEARVNAAGLPADARLISRASVPHKPYSPRVSAITALVTMAVTVLAVAFILMREFLVGAVLVRGSGQSHEEGVAEIAGANVTMMAMESPEVPVAPLSDVETSPANLWARLMELEVPPKCLVVVSTDDDEMASRAAIALLRAAVSENACPILLEVSAEPQFAVVDGEGEEPHRGFVDLLNGEASFSQVIMRDPRSRAHVIAGAGRPLSDQEAEAPLFDTVLEALAHTYDHIVVDLGRLTPSVSTAKFLARADHVVLVAGDHSGGPSLDRTRRMLESKTGAGLSVLAPQRRDGAARGERDMAA